MHDLLAARPDKPESKGASWFLYERRNEHQAIAEAVDTPIVLYNVPGRTVADMPPETTLRLAQYGPNTLPSESERGTLWRFLAQFNSVLVYVLLGAAVGVSLFTGISWLTATERVGAGVDHGQRSHAGGAGAGDDRAREPAAGHGR